MDLPVLVVGDVHGDLERLFSGLKPYPPDSWRTIFLGDLVDGGPFGVGALRYARDRPNSAVLLGNHEVLLLGALRDRAERGPGLHAWLGAGGQPHDLEELARDEPLQEWLRRRPALLRLEDGTLAQHCDSDELGSLVPARDEAAGGDADAGPDAGRGLEFIAAINREVARLIAAGDLAPLIDRMTSRGVFRRQTLRLEAWLRRTGAVRVVHGHTPHRSRQPEVYAGGRAICFDGGMGRWGRPGALRGGSIKGSIGPLPRLNQTGE
ncbi:MAG TPA: metallophosphoesterase [Candidatus Dormibacteraeota bacterium]